jgi:hypothetical protein
VRYRSRSAAGRGLYVGRGEMVAIAQCQEGSTAPAIPALGQKLRNA